MNATEQVEYEHRVRMRYAVLAALAGVLVVGSAALQLSGPHTKVDELTLDLLIAHRRYPLDLIGAILDGIGLVALAGTLNFLHSAAHARNTEIRPFIRWLAVAGGLLSAVMAIAYAVVIADKANQFAASTVQTYMRADALTKGGAVSILPLFAQLGSLMLAIGFIWIALNALRVGLLTRFMGYLGVFAGVLVLFPIGSPVPVVQGFWLVALGVIFAGRWPAGQPPAWEAGVAMPWAPAGQPRGGGGGGAARAGRERASTGGTRRTRTADVITVTETAAPAAGAEDAAAAGRTRATTPKRKRKRRH